MQTATETVQARTLAIGEVLVLWHGRPHRLRDGEQGLVACLDGRPVGYLLWEVSPAGGGCRPYIERDYVTLHSAWVSPLSRRRGIFDAMFAILLQLNPEMPVTGLSQHAWMQERFEETCKLPGRNCR